MIKRIVAVPLWFVAGWMVAAMAAFLLGLPSWLAPLAAVSVAALVALDPAGWFQARSTAASTGQDARLGGLVGGSLPND